MFAKCSLGDINYLGGRGFYATVSYCNTKQFKDGSVMLWKTARILPKGVDLYKYIQNTE